MKLIVEKVYVCPEIVLRSFNSIMEVFTTLNATSGDHESEGEGGGRKRR
jgi:hypothetical protein